MKNGRAESVLVKATVFGEGADADHGGADNRDEGNQSAALGHNQYADTDHEGHERESGKCFEKNHIPSNYRFAESVQA